MTLSQYHNAHEFSSFVRILARGKKGARNMSRDEAKAAMELLLQGKALPEQIGAFFMLMRVKEETAEELAGFAEACRPLWKDVQTDIVWPSYAGKRRQPAWYMLVIQLLKQMGYRVLIHGTSGHTEGRQYTLDLLADFKIPSASNIEQAPRLTEKNGIVYLPCESLHPDFLSWLMTKHTLGLRSPINTLLRLIAPDNCLGVQSVFHPNYAPVHQAAASMIEKRALIIKGEGGEFEVNPERATQCLHSGIDLNDYKIQNDRSHFEGKHEAPSLNALMSLWKNEDNEYGYEAVTRTLAVILSALDTQAYDASLAKAKHAWKTRTTSLFS